MRINPSNDAAALKTSTTAAATTARAERVAATPATAAASRDGVPVSVSASARVLDAVTPGTGIDAAKVAAMRAAIADGTFSVNAGAIADKLLSNAQEFLSHSRS